MEHAVATAPAVQTKSVGCLHEQRGRLDDVGLILKRQGAVVKAHIGENSIHALPLHTLSTIVISQENGGVVGERFRLRLVDKSTNHQTDDSGDNKPVPAV